MTGNSGSDFRIKLLVVHPDGRRQKFLVTFPERRTLKIDQRYIGLPLTLRVDFVPGAIICRPGTGHTLTIAGKPAKEHSLSVNDTVGLDQYSIEFLELPEPLPMEESTRFVNINEMVEATVVAALPRDLKDDGEFTPLPQVSPHSPAQANHQLPFAPQPPPAPQPSHNRTPTPAPRVPEAPVAHVQPTPAPNYQQPPQYQQPQYQAPQYQVPQQAVQPQYQPEVHRPDPEDSTAIIRRLQVPGAQPVGQNTYSNYSTLEPAARADATTTGTYSRNTSTGFVADHTESGAEQARPGFALKKSHMMVGGAALLLVLAYIAIGPKFTGSTQESKELASEQTQAEPTDEMKPIELPESEPTQTQAAPETKPEAVVAVEPDPAVVPNALIPAPVPMATGGSAPVSNPFDDANGGFDPMATTQFFAAVEAGDEAKIKELIEKRVVDVNLSRQKGYAVLHLAAANGDLQTVKFLIRMKADVNVLDGSGATPLMWAVFRRREDVVKFLAPKTDLKIERQGGETAFALAKRMKQTKLLKMLDPEPKKKTARKSDSKKRVPTALPDKKK